MNSVDTVRIAMWSGPRNISTAMMRSFENRPDTSVSDEPFYAAYLAKTGFNHPMRDDILASQATDPEAVVRFIVGPSPLGRPIWYQKHMTHHMLPGFDRSWIDGMVNVFLIRDPAAVLASYVKKRADVTLEEIGLPQQVELFDRVSDRLGQAPAVIESDDVLANPEAMLQLLCERCGIGFHPGMLRWPTGPRSSDGVWAPAWYDQVIASSGFAPPRTAINRENLDPELGRVADTARPFYDRLIRHRMSARPHSVPT